jgi:hypothetical protein
MATKLHSIIAAMWVEYNRDQECDYRHINRLIEDAADIVAEEVGGDAALDKLGESHVDDPIWEAWEKN